MEVIILANELIFMSTLSILRKVSLLTPHLKIIRFFFFSSLGKMTRILNNNFVYTFTIDQQGDTAGFYSQSRLD